MIPASKALGMYNRILYSTQKRYNHKSNLVFLLAGRLAQASGTLTAVFVESEVKRALEWLQDAPTRRYAAVLVLKELAENAPTLFYVHVASFFDLVWAALHDNTVQTREAAVEALQAALAVISEREHRLRVQWYHKIYEEANKVPRF
jgi:FKBP12-rapamycin complex-associated protein